MFADKSFLTTRLVPLTFALVEDLAWVAMFAARSPVMSARRGHRSLKVFAGGLR
jgi:hypothetical protein